MNAVQRFAWITAIVGVLIFMLLPVMVVVGISVGASATYDFPPRELSLRWFANLLHTPIFSDALLKVSLPLGIAVALCSTVLGLAAALGIAHLPEAAGRRLSLLLASPLVFPQVLLGVALFLLYARAGMPLTMFSLGLGHVLIATPYVIRSVSAALGGLDSRLEEAAQSLGASPTQALFRVTLPLLKSGILSGAVFAFIVSFSDINLAIFLSTAGNTTLPMQVLAQMQFVSDPTIAAAATVQILVVAALVMVVQFLLRRRS